MTAMTKACFQIWRGLLQGSTMLVLMDIHHHTVELDIPLREGTPRLGIPRPVILLTVDTLMQPILIKADTPPLVILAPIITLAMDTDTVWEDCWLVEQLLQPLPMALIILRMHAHLALVTENSNMGSSNMGNLESVGMEANSRDGSDKFATTICLTYIVTP